MLLMICAKYGENESRIVDFLKVKVEKMKNLRKIEIWEICYKRNTLHTL